MYVCCVHVVQVQCCSSQDVPSLHSESQKRHFAVSQRQPVWRTRSEVSEGFSGNPVDVYFSNVWLVLYTLLNLCSEPLSFGAISFPLDVLAIDSLCVQVCRGQSTEVQRVGSGARGATAAAVLGKPPQGIHRHLHQSSQDTHDHVHRG